jgi:hypothetical protein
MPVAKMKPLLVARRPLGLLDRRGGLGLAIGLFAG